MKFLLIKMFGGWTSANSGFNISTKRSIFPPLGLEYLAASLEKEGHTAKIMDMGIEPITKEQLNKSVMNSDAVGISVEMDTYSSVAEMSKTINEIDPDIPQILGGSHCSFIKQKTLKDMPFAEICCEGEGEKTIIDLAKFLQGKKKISDINGIYYREKNKIKSGKPPEFIKNLDSIPFPARHLVEKNEYGKFMNAYPFKRKFTTMASSRGCPFKCRFCARFSNVIENYGYRERSAEDVVKEIEEASGKYRSMMIVDDNFIVNVKRAHKICDMLIERKNEVDLLVLGVRVDTATRELYTKMKKAGFKYLAFGIESGNQDVLDYYNKNITLEQIRKAVNLGSELGFLMSATFILGAPIETRKHFENTINFARSLPLDIALFGGLSYQKGSDLWNEAVKNKLISKNEEIVLATKERNLGNFSQEEIQEFTKECFRRFYLRPSFILSEIFKAVERRNFGLVKIGFRQITGI